MNHHHEGNEISFTNHFERISLKFILKSFNLFFSYHQSGFAEISRCLKVIYSDTFEILKVKLRCRSMTIPITIT